MSLDVQNALRRFISPYVRPDGHAAQRPGYKYQVYSLYLDSADLALYRGSTEGRRNRFKLRVRSYDGSASAAKFLEIKRRVGSVVVKSRTRVDAATAQAIAGLPSAWHGARLVDGMDAVGDEFLSKMAFVNAAPTIHVRYNREAYESRDGEPVRVTFDTELSYAPVTADGNHDVTMEAGGSQRGEPPCDPRAWRSVPISHAILEIKFTERYPGWVRALVERFELVSRSIPKYCLSVAHACGGAEHAAGGMLATVAHSPLWLRRF